MQKAMNGAMSIRSREGVDALNNGTPYMMSTSDVNVPAFMMQDGYGNMTVSVFDSTGINVEVYDLKKVIDDANNYLEENKDEFFLDDTFDNTKFWDYKLDKMLKTGDRINYTIDFSLTKIDDKWVLDELLETDRQKIHGLYS